MLGLLLAFDQFPDQHVHEHHVGWIDEGHVLEREANPGI